MGEDEKINYRRKSAAGGLLRHLDDSVGLAGRIVVPAEQGFGGAGDGQVNGDQAAIRMRQAQFFVEFVIAKSDRSGFGPRICKDDAADARPVGRRKTHRTRLAGGVQGAAGQVETIQCGTGSPYGLNFGMSSRVFGRNDLIPAFTDNFFLVDDYRAKGPALAEGYALRGKLHGTFQEKFVVSQ